MGYEVKIGLSNKHLHLSQEHLDILFGKGYQLVPTKPLVQPGQFAAEEKVDIVGPKSTLKGIRVLGPVRPETQVELSMTDARTIGCLLYTSHKRKDEIGIHSVRGGTIFGEHQVIFAMKDEVIEIKHTAFSKTIFAKGAIEAAIWIKDKNPGYYTIDDVFY